VNQNRLRLVMASHRLSKLPAGAMADGLLEGGKAGAAAAAAVWVVALVGVAPPADGPSLLSVTGGAVAVCEGRAVRAGEAGRAAAALGIVPVASFAAAFPRLLAPA
jgi:hypothetical protein